MSAIGVPAANQSESRLVPWIIFQFCSALGKKPGNIATGFVFGT
jgi:hypothetical protein